MLVRLLRDLAVYRANGFPAAAFNKFIHTLLGLYMYALNSSIIALVLKLSM